MDMKKTYIVADMDGNFVAQFPLRDQAKEFAAKNKRITGHTLFITEKAWEYFGDA